MTGGVTIPSAPPERVEVLAKWAELLRAAKEGRITRLLIDGQEVKLPECAVKQPTVEQRPAKVDRPTSEPEPAPQPVVESAPAVRPTTNVPFFKLRCARESCGETSWTSKRFGWKCPYCGGRKAFVVPVWRESLRKLFSRGV